MDDIRYQTMNSGIEPISGNVWSLKAEPRTRSDWKDELYGALGLASLVINLIVLDMELCEIKTVN